MNPFPRVLLIYKNRISEFDSGGASLGRWFAEWPRGNLAQVYTGGNLEGSAFCAREYKLGGLDRRMGWIFDKLKRSSLGSSASIHTTTRPSSRRAWQRKAIHAISRALVGSGLWEILFSPKLSPLLITWLQDFDPQLIFSQVPDLSLMRWTSEIHDHFQCPLCLQMSDDYSEALYRDTWSSLVLRPQVKKAFVNLVANAGLCFGTGEAMAQEYAKRYGKRFEPLYICDNSSRFRQAQPTRKGSSSQMTILYSGNLGLERWRSLGDLVLVVESLNSAGLNIVIQAYVPAVPEEGKRILFNRPCLKFFSPPKDDDVPGLFKGADLLFLPEGFDVQAQRVTKLSISTKSHLYMMSERPILVYGPRGIGVVEYAKEFGWARVVDEHSLTKLSEAVKELLQGSELQRSEQTRGWQVAMQNHEGKNVREKFRRDLQSLIT